jgi:hypothetical protein
VESALLHQHQNGSDLAEEVFHLAQQVT